MTRATSAAARLVHAAAAFTVLGLLAAPPAGAAGTGGIEVSPVPAVVDGRQVTSFRAELPGSGAAEVDYALRNITDEPRSARIYAAAARPDGRGGFTVGDAGSSRYVVLADRTVDLQPRQVRAETFRVQAPRGDRPTDLQYAAVVVEVQQGAVVQRAATLVYLEPGSQLPLPLWAVALAGLLVLVAAAALVVAVRRRSRVGGPPTS